MLTRTFVHIPGIGPKTEKGLWNRGIQTWDDWKKEKAMRFGLGRSREIDAYLEASRTYLEKGDPRFFARRMPAPLMWRLFPEFREKTVYLDIETTGLSAWQNEITTIALYDGKTISYYVNGENLHRFPGDLARYAVVVTYNGKSFDIPFIERYFGIRVACAHIDLRHVLSSLGLKGGLKGCERRLGMDRGDLEGLDGYFAVVLWQEYRRHGRPGALETLLAYNIADVLSLERLMVTAYNRKLMETPFAGILDMDMPRMPENPFSAHMDTVLKIKRDMASGKTRQYWNGR